MHDPEYLYLALAALLVVIGISVGVREYRAWQREQAQLKRAEMRARIRDSSPADSARRVC